MTTDDPIARFLVWFDEIQRTDMPEPASVALATADAEGHPSCRIVLLKGADDRGFVFFTNFESRKGRELAENPWAALCFHWEVKGRQVRARGPVERVSDAEADAYWKTRSRESQLGAWASDQSRPVATREELLRRLGEAEARYEGREVPRPPHWSGFRVVAEEIEFWERAEHRLHYRERFLREDGAWQRELLFP